MDWITPAKTAGWALLRVGEWVLRFCHLATVPLRYLLWHLLRLVLFLLAPVRALFGAVAAAAEFAVDLVAKFKLSFAAVIGILAGLALHQTSRSIFVLLGVDPTQHQQLRRRHRHRGESGSETEDDGDWDWEEGGEGEELHPWGASGDGSSSSPTAIAHRLTDPNPGLRFPTSSAAAAEKPRRPRGRRRGLLAQTIHEESSESGSF